MQRCLLILISLFVCFSLFAQKQAPYDTASIEVRTFSDSSINAYKADKTFQYQKTIEPAVSWWDRFWSWFWEWIDSILSTRAGQTTLWILLIAIGVAALVFLIWRVNGMNKSSLFERNAGGSSAYNINEENIHAISFEEAINKAVAEGNYRLAVRLLYLQTLKLLTDKQYINWQLNKTNYEYVNEMKTHPLYILFARLTNAFEYVWYGSNEVTREWFGEIRTEFQQFK